MKQTAMPLCFFLFAAVFVLPLPAANATAVSVLNSTPSDSQVAKLKATRTDFKAFRDHLARVRRAVKERFAEVKTRDIRAARLDRHLNKEVAHLDLKIADKAPSVFMHDIRGVLDPKEVKEVSNMEAKVDSILKEFNELRDLQASAMDGTTAAIIAKVSNEIVDLNNEIAIFDAILSGLDKKIRDIDLPAATSVPVPSAPTQVSSRQPMTKSGRDEAPPHAGDHLSFGSGRGSGGGAGVVNGGTSGGAQSRGSSGGSGRGSSASDDGFVSLRDKATGRTRDVGPIEGPGRPNADHDRDRDHDTEGNDEAPPL